MRAIVSVLVVVAFQGSLHAQPAPSPSPPGSPPTGEPYRPQEPASAPYPTPPGQTAPTPGAPYPTPGTPYPTPGTPYPTPGTPYPTPGTPYPTPGAPYPAPVPYPYPPGALPPYAYGVAQLSEEDQALLARGEISDGRYIGGALASVFFGFGIGQAVHGRYHETGWIFTLGEAGTLAALAVGLAQALDCFDFNNECQDDNDGEALMVGGMLGFIAFRAWELVDVFAAPPRHNARVRDLRMRLGLPPPMYSRVQPYIAPSLSRDGTAAGLTFRF